MAILANPIGDFPVNDDWAYGWTVRNLLETGHFQLADWTATNLLPQALWGTLFCLPFGFSFTALRLSTLILGLAGVITTYGLLSEAGASSRISLFCSLIIALNPIYFALSNSFNSDIPSFTFAVVSVYFLVRGIRLDSRGAILTGLIFTFIAILNRQSSIVILPAFGIIYLVRNGLTFKNFIKAFLPTLAGMLINAGYSYWLDFTKQKPLLYGFQVEKLMETVTNGPGTIAFTYGQNVWLFSIYVGAFLFPFLMLQFAQQFKKYSFLQKQLSLGLTLFLLTIGLILISKGTQMPLTGNTLVPLGLGPSSLGDYNSLEGHRYFRVFVRGCWALLTLAGLIGTSILIQYFLIAIQSLLNRKKRIGQAALVLFLLISTFLYLLPIGGVSKSFWFDRYLILPLPLLMASIFILTRPFFDKSNLRRSIVIFAYISLFCCGIFTISATHDFLLQKRVHWLALDNLMRRSHVLPSQIGAGFEFNGWYHFGASLKTCNPNFHQTTVSHVDWGSFTCLWDDQNSEYTVGYTPKAGYQQQAQYQYRRWLPWRKEVLYVLRKNK
jgi:hypothetical protein